MDQNRYHRSKNRELSLDIEPLYHVQSWRKIHWQNQGGTGWWRMGSAATKWRCNLILRLYTIDRWPSGSPLKTQSGVRQSHLGHGSTCRWRCSSNSGRSDSLLLEWLWWDISSNTNKISLHFYGTRFYYDQMAHRVSMLNLAPIFFLPTQLSGNPSLEEMVHPPHLQWWMLNKHHANVKSGCIGCE